MASGGKARSGELVISTPSSFVREVVDNLGLSKVIRVFGENLGRLRDLLFAVIAALPEERDCECATALANARFTA
jgi:hypothetical protein